MEILEACLVEREGGRLRLETGETGLVLRWNGGDLVGERLVGGGVEWPLSGEAPDTELPGHPTRVGEATLAVHDIAGTAFRPPYRRVEITARYDRLEVRRVFCLYPGCPMIGFRLEMRGCPPAGWRRGMRAVSDLPAIESAAGDCGAITEPLVMYRLFLPHFHLDLESIQFFDVTDRRNNLVWSRRIQPYRQSLPLTGNVLVVRDRFERRGLVLLKEAFCSDVQWASPGFDFVSRLHEIQVVGPGFHPDELEESEWTVGDGIAIGVGDDVEALRDFIHRYLMRLRRYYPGRDNLVLLNTWGDRSAGKNLDEMFARREIEAGRRLGVSHFQLDHGWETTQAEDRQWPLRLEGIWETPHFWNVHRGRFPSGLKPVVVAARRAGIELGLWFNPSPDDDYAHWQDDAGVLIGLFRECGIRVFKIDGVQLPNKRAEVRFRRFLDAVMEATGGEAVFNLDITAGRRFGYFTFCEYGNKFLENRYTDWVNYYPHWTLRNLWMLSRWIPPRTLQIEFLNRWRNAERYPEWDPLAPSRVPFDYCFAITMPAQPLAWFEATGLPEEAFEIAPLVMLYRAHQTAIHAGITRPIGEEPSGVGWTGFQTVCGPSAGYVFVYREWNDRERAFLALRGLERRRVTFYRIAGGGRSFEAVADEEGRVAFSLPESWMFGWYAYVVEEGGKS